jgi:hypothetical protein
MSNLTQIQLLINNIPLADLAKIEDLIKIRKFEAWLDHLPEDIEEFLEDEELEVKTALESISEGDRTYTWESIREELGIKDVEA